MWGCWPKWQTSKIWLDLLPSTTITTTLPILPKRKIIFQTCLSWEFPDRRHGLRSPLTPPQPPATAPVVRDHFKRLLRGQRSRSEDFPLSLSSGHTIQAMVLRSQHCVCQRGTSAWWWMAVSSEKVMLKGWKDTYWYHIDRCQYISIHVILWHLMVIVLIWLKYLLFSNLSCIRSFWENCPSRPSAQIHDSFRMSRTLSSRKEWQLTPHHCNSNNWSAKLLVADTKVAKKNTLI